MKSDFSGNLIEITDGCEAVFDGVKSVKEYGRDYIILKLKSYSVKITGDEIIISEFLEGRAIVLGKIFSVSFMYD